MLRGLKLNELLKVVFSLVKILKAVLLLPAADVLDYISLKITEVVGSYVVPWLNCFGGVMLTANLLVICIHIKAATMS